MMNKDIEDIPKTAEESKKYIRLYMARLKTIDEVEREKKELETSLESYVQEDSRDFLQKQLNNLNNLLADTDYIYGNYHQGIDQILFELIEWVAIFYAFQNVNIHRQPFDQHIFFKQWAVGGTYAMYSSLAKLVSSNSQDKSLRKLWWDIKDFIQVSENQKEIQYISKQLNKGTGRFSNQGSKAILFRNKVIAHNEKSVNTDLKHLDEDIQFLVRVWSLITMWSESTMLFPFRDNKQTFSALEHFCSLEELEHLKSKRQEYLDKATIWCKTNLVTGEEENETPFGTLSLSVSVVSK